jgi:hypothetical protein
MPFIFSYYANVIFTNPEPPNIPAAQHFAASPQYVLAPDNPPPDGQFT